jgi:hypothetical protein
MEVSGPVQGARTKPRRRRLYALLAIVVLAALVVLLVWAGAFARSGAGVGDANTNAGSAVIRDDGLYYPLPHGKSAVIRDAGNVNRNTGSAVIHDDPWNLHPKQRKGDSP